MCSGNFLKYIFHFWSERVCYTNPPNPSYFKGPTITCEDLYNFWEVTWFFYVIILHYFFGNFFDLNNLFKFFVDHIHRFSQFVSIYKKFVSFYAYAYFHAYAYLHADAYFLHMDIFMNFFYFYVMISFLFYTNK